MRRSLKAEELVIGGEPRVDLMPPEERAAGRAKYVRKRLGILLLAVTVLVVAGVVAASALAAHSQGQLLAAQARTAELIEEQAKYVEVRQVQNEIGMVTAARQAGAASEIDWNDYLSAVRAVLPPDVTIGTVSADSAAPFETYEQATVPLQGERVATLTLGLTSPTLPIVPAWLEGLQTLPGYADATPSSITRTETGSFLVMVTLHVNDGAYSNRFATTTED